MTIRPFDPERHCGATSKRCHVDPPTCRHADGDHRCRNPKGYNTGHLGSGTCKWHLGMTPNLRRHAQREAAEKAVAALGLPSGSGDPFELLEKAVRYAEGFLEAAASVVHDSTAGDKPKLDLEAATVILARAIREASRTAKATVDADIAERMAKVDIELKTIVLRAVSAALDAAGVTGDLRVRAKLAAADVLEPLMPAGAELN